MKKKERKKVLFILIFLYKKKVPCKVIILFSIDYCYFVDVVEVVEVHTKRKKLEIKSITLPLLCITEHRF